MCVGRGFGVFVGCGGVFEAAMVRVAVGVAVDVRVAVPVGTAVDVLAGLEVGTAVGEFVGDGVFVDVAVGVALAV